jgi:hypothetical protein
MLEDDFKRMMDYFHQTIEGKPINLEELCGESLQFFEKVRHAIENGTDKEKEEAMLLMSEMYKKLVSECKQLTEKTGMSEEQIMGFAENPNNFSQEQWQMLQDTRHHMTRTGEALANILQKQPKDVPPSHPESKPSSQDKKKIHKLKKTNWMRS